MQNTSGCVNTNLVSRFTENNISYKIWACPKRELLEPFDTVNCLDRIPVICTSMCVKNDKSKR